MCSSDLRLKDIDLTNYSWRPSRRFLVPKGYLAFRPVTQLDPLDAIFLSALVFEIGADIEKRRRPVQERRVFSYRFRGASDGTLYSSADSWADFWKVSKERAASAKYVLLTDIADFYNQIYHHVIENQLDSAGVRPPLKYALTRLLQQDSEKVSRGIPIGPHATHLLAELSLVPSDNFFCDIGMRFCRFVDDIHVFCDSESQAHVQLHKMAAYFDATQKLTLNKQKTKVMSSTAFQSLCDSQLTDHPINSNEARILEVVRRNSRSPYARVGMGSIAPAERPLFDKATLEDILSAYLAANDVDHVRLRWFLRRLAQVGAPGAVAFCLKNFERLVPEVAEVAGYLQSAEESYVGPWPELGADLLKVYSGEVAKPNEYLRIVLLGLFGRMTKLDNLPHLFSLYENVRPSEQREIILAAAAAGAVDWVRQFKGRYLGAEPWTARAMAYAMRILPRDEFVAWKSMARNSVKDELLLTLLLACL
mgnify:CR=1 FL=1